MKYIFLLFILYIILPATLYAYPGDALSEKEVQNITPLYFGEIKENCYTNSKNQKTCYKSRICKKDTFKNIGESKIIYYRLTETYTRYIDNFRDESTKYCSGEPESITAIIYKKTKDKYIELGSIGASQCVLFIDNIVDYGKNTIVKTKCETPGTGHFTEESVYLIDGSNIHKILFDVKSSGLPHAPLGIERFNIQNNHIIYRSSSDRKTCQCVESFKAEFRIIRDNEGAYKFSYIEGSYKPLFTTQSNAKNQKGLSYYTSKKYQLAIEAFQSAIELDVSNYQAYSNLGLAYIKNGDLDKSIKSSQYVYDHAEDQLKANAAYNLGAAYEKNENYQMSLRYYTASNKIKPTKARKDAIVRIKNLLTNQNDRK